MNYQVFFGFGDYTEIKSTELPVDNERIFASLEEAKEAIEQYKSQAQAFRCSCMGLNKQCHDCGGTGWI